MSSPSIWHSWTSFLSFVCFFSPNFDIQASTSRWQKNSNGLTRHCCCSVWYKDLWFYTEYTYHTLFTTVFGNFVVFEGFGKNVLKLSLQLTEAKESFALWVCCCCWLSYFQNFLFWDVNIGRLPTETWNSKEQLKTIRAQLLSCFSFCLLLRWKSREILKESRRLLSAELARACFLATWTEKGIWGEVQQVASYHLLLHQVSCPGFDNFGILDLGSITLQVYLRIFASYWAVCFQGLVKLWSSPPVRPLPSIKMRSKLNQNPRTTRLACHEHLKFASMLLPMLWVAMENRQFFLSRVKDP